jgi:hypothetical protein
MVLSEKENLENSSLTAQAAVFSFNKFISTMLLRLL